MNWVKLTYYLYGDFVNTCTISYKLEAINLPMFNPYNNSGKIIIKIDNIYWIWGLDKTTVIYILHACLKIQLFPRVIYRIT